MPNIDIGFIAYAINKSYDESNNNDINKYIINKCNNELNDFIGLLLYNLKDYFSDEIEIDKIIDNLKINKEEINKILR